MQHCVIFAVWICFMMRDVDRTLEFLNFPYLYVARSFNNQITHFNRFCQLYSNTAQEKASRKNSIKVM